MIQHWKSRRKNGGKSSFNFNSAEMVRADSQRKKTIEVRKTKPKIPTPFKCYIYETKAIYKPSGSPCLFQGRGKVIGEFVCDEITSGLWIAPFTDYLQSQSCLSYDEVCDYANGKPIFAWHIYNLKIYDKPKELGEFHQPCECLDEYEDEVYCDCFNCEYARDSDYGVIACRRTITRPPQSWCYVERLEGEG